MSVTVTASVSGSSLDNTFHALADPTRRALISQLRDGAQRVTDLAREHAMSLNAVSKHIKVLERAGLVDRHIAGREHRIGLSADPLVEAADWLEQTRDFWEARLDRLDRVLRDSAPSAAQETNPTKRTQDTKEEQ